MNILNFIYTVSFGSNANYLLNVMYCNGVEITIATIQTDALNIKEYASKLLDF